MSEPVAVEQRPTEHRPSERRPRIVIVEDDASLLGALTFALEADGFRVDAHASAETVLAAGAEPDCLVVDLRLPGMDGLALIARLRERRVGAPAILVTTNPDDRVRAAAEAAGVPIVEKPLIGGELRRRIDEAVARGP
jgi:DNA-binding response OmpR family regulator